MSKELDVKIFNQPKVLLQKLNLHIDNEEKVFKDMCLLPKVHLEKLSLQLLSPHTSERSLLETSHEEKDENSETIKDFARIPVVSLTRCDVSGPHKTNKKVSFHLTRLKFPYKIVGPYKNAQIRDCSVHLKRYDLNKLKQTWRHEKSTLCKLCGKVYFSRKKLNYHQERKHDLVATTPSTEKRKRVSFSNKVTVYTPYHRCRKCLKIFETYKILKTHMRLMHRKRNRYVCDYCEKLFADRTIFKLHIRLHCDKCGELLEEKKELIAHKKFACPSERKIKKYVCLSCDEVFFSNVALKEHSYSHLIEKTLICEICKENFNTSCGLVKHLQTHKKNKNGIQEHLYTILKKGLLKSYVCHVCKKKFNDESAIESHLGIKTVIYSISHRCNICKQDFATDEDLLRHTWTHVNDAPINVSNGVTSKCDDATLTASIPGNTSGHKGTITNGIVRNGHKRPTKGKKKFPCPICDKLFTRSSDIKRHVNSVHLKDKPQPLHQCSVCEETFAWKSLLDNHKCLREVRDDLVSGIDDVYQTPMFSGFLDELPMMNDVMTHIDFDIPSPSFEFASVQLGVAAPETFRTAPSSRSSCKYIRHEVPIEF